MVKNAADAVAHSVVMAALTRLLVVMGTPAMLGMLAWFAGNFIALREVVAVQTAAQSRLVIEMADLQAYRRDAFARGVARDKQDQVFQQSIDEIKRALERLSDRTPSPPSRL